MDTILTEHLLSNKSNMKRAKPLIMGSNRKKHIFRCPHFWKNYYFESQTELKFDPRSSILTKFKKNRSRKICILGAKTNEMTVKFIYFIISLKISFYNANHVRI